MTSSVFAGLAAQEFGASDDKAALLELLHPIFPEPDVHAKGFHYFAPDEIKHLDALFERFGLSLRSTDARFEDIGYLTEVWYRLVSGFGSHIKCSLYSPSLFKSEIAAWPKDFQEYLTAVITQDLPKAQALAKSLDVENMKAKMPSSLFG